MTVKAGIESKQVDLLISHWTYIYDMLMIVDPTGLKAMEIGLTITALKELLVMKTPVDYNWKKEDKGDKER